MAYGSFILSTISFYNKFFVIIGTSLNLSSFRGRLDHFLIYDNDFRWFLSRLK